jgi:excinuclease ABC subunit A
VITKNDNDFFSRLADAIEIAFYEGNGYCHIENIENSNIKYFSNNFELDGIKFLEPNIHLFSFNNPYGACPKCEGYGDIIGIDKSLVVPNTSLSVYENAIFPWRGESMSYYRDLLVNNGHLFNFPIINLIMN